MPDFPLDAYFARIGWTGAATSVPPTLIGLHRAHALAIPFENLDPLGGIPVSLEPIALVEKILHRRRGGYCFEQNGLFLLALQALGFRVRPLLARVQISEGNYGPRSHQITLVECDGTRWLADVGFGGNGLVEPIPLELDREFDHGHDRFRLAADETYGYRLEHRLPAGWRTNYAFSLDPYLSADFRALNFFTSRSPDAIFTRVPICVRTTATQRRILVADRFQVRALDGAKTTIQLTSAAHLREILADQFDLSLPADLVLPEPAPAPSGMRKILAG